MENPRTILIVDDNELAAKGLGTLLEHSGHTVHSAYTGTDALVLAGVHHPQVIILDVSLPDISGYEIAKRLRSEGNKALLIALSGYGAQEDKDKAFAAGFDHHLIKPIRVSDVQHLFMLG